MHGPVKPHKTAVSASPSRGFDWLDVVLLLSPIIFGILALTLLNGIFLQPF